MKMTRSLAMRRDTGFTLTEIMVVIVILGLLAGMGIKYLPGYLEKGKIGRARSDVSNLNDMIENYMMEATDSPREDEIFEKLIEAKIYREKTQPKDPWGQVYKVQLEDGHYTVYSCGPDKQPETDDDVFARGQRKDLNDDR